MRICAFAVAALVLPASVFQSVADEASCTGPKIDASEAFDPDAGLPGIINAKSVLVEHQILNVRSYRPVISNSREASGSPTRYGLALFLDGDPSPKSDVVQTVVEFVPAGTLREAQYVPARRTILLFFDIEKYLPLKHALESCAPVYSQYRRYESGHIFADVHVGEVPTGQ